MVGIQGRGFWAMVAVATVALAAPSVRAQTLTINSKDTFGPGDCDNDTKVTVQFSYSGGTAPTTGVQLNYTVEVIAVEGDCPDVASGAQDVTVPSGGQTLSPRHTPTAAQLQGETATFAVRTMAKNNCSTVQTNTWNVCVYDFWTTASVLTANTSQSSTLSHQLVYDAQPPGAPTLTSVDSSDQHLRVALSPPDDDDIDHYDILVSVAPDDGDGGPNTAPQAGGVDGGAATGSTGSTGTTGSTSGTTGSTGSTGTSSASSSSSSSGTTGSGSTGTSSGSSSSSSSSSTGSSGSTGNTAYECMDAPSRATFANAATDGVVPDGSGTLANGVRYLVQARAVDKAGNPGPCSNILSGTPVQINDFWRTYRGDGGQSIGCSAAGAGPAVLSLLGLLGLGRLHRRKGVRR